jgi:hypothetical protein
VRKGSCTSGIAWAIILFWVIVLLIAFGCTAVHVIVGDGNVHESDKGVIVKPKEHPKSGSKVQN